MSQIPVSCDDGHEVVVGWDRPFHTFFAQLYEPGADFDDSPLRTVGYHPTEQGLTPESQHGPYPVENVDDLFKLIGSWGLSDDDVERVREALEAEVP